MEATESNLEIKLTQLRMNVKKTDSVMESNNPEAIDRHQQTLRTISANVSHMRLEVEEKKLVAKEEETSIQTWNENVDARLQEADIEIGKVRKWLDEYNKEAELNAKQERLKFEEELQKMKLQLKTEQQAKKSLSEGAYQASSSGTMQAKLPKLVITKFDGTYMDWPRFWGQFSETIDKTSVPAITKFTYLRELVEPKVSKAIEALPFTAEGYNRAKSILKERYGKDSEIIKAYTKEILDLPTVTNANPNKISEFSEKLTYSVQALQALNKLEQVNGAVLMTLDKLPGIRGDLVRTDPDWERWDFAKLSEAISLWLRRNPIDARAIGRDFTDQRNQKRERPNKLFQARGHEYKSKDCVYCGESGHKLSECQKVSSIDERKQILAKKKLCFNCATANHRAAECFSKASCQHCRKRHHTSICDHKQTGNGRQTLMTASQNKEGILPVVTLKVNGIICRALIDTGAGSSYGSAKLLDLTKSKPYETKTKRVDMLISSQVARLEMYDTIVESLDGSYQMSVKLTKVNKGELLWIDNPKYEQMVDKYPHMHGVKITDRDTKGQLPVHVVLGSGEYARIKTETKPRIGREGEPVAEKTKLGWFIMSPGTEFDHNTMLLTQTSQSDYEDLCRLDILGLSDAPEHDQSIVYAEFKEQLQRSPEGWYETGLPWRGQHPELLANKQGSLRRLSNLIKKLERNNLVDEYDGIIREQLASSIIEVAPEEVKGKEFYIPHKAVIRETAETTKMRIVYDASAKETPTSPSLNECLYPGPSLQNKMWDVLIRQRAYPVAVAGDIRKAFLQIRIRECERDALRFHWRKSCQTEIETLRFTRALFGLAPSPFLLAGVLEAHLDAWEKREPEIVAELRRALYVDDLLTGGKDDAEAKKRRKKAVEVLGDATFELHKWNSNSKQLEEENNLTTAADEQSFAKQQLNVKPTESKMLGLKWDKEQDTLAVVIPTDEVLPTKRGILAKLAKIYDPLGLVAPLTLTGKQIYREVCEAKAPWDTPLIGGLLQRWTKWEQSLPKEKQVPRAIAQFKETIESVELHSFGDASKGGVGAAVYAVVRQKSGITQLLIAGKSRLAKQGLTIPRLELVSAHMATNLLINVRNALDNLPKPKMYGWLDSTVALHWIQGDGQYKEFVANRVAKIQLQKEITWRYVPSEDNPADLASRGGQVQSSELWNAGPEWLQDKKSWPENPVTKPSPASEAEKKLIRVILNVARPIRDEFQDLLQYNSLPKTLRICGWIKRFLTNCRKVKPERVGGPLTTEELEEQKTWWTKRVQKEAEGNEKFQTDKLQLNLQLNNDGIVECRGRIIGFYPIYLPDDHLFTTKFVQQAHLATLHGGASLTMAKVRETHWVPRLRSLTKKVRKSCWGCKRFRAQAYASPPPGKLPMTRTEGVTPYENVGIDFAGPIKYRVKPKQEGKAYLVLYACCLTRGVYLDVLPSLQTDKFLTSFKTFIARRGRPRYIYTDNGSTFKAAADWLNKVRKNEKFHDCLAKLEVTWRFNLSRAPWWGGQFERLIGIFKSAFRKVIGNGFLTWSELCDVVLDVEITMNNRPLSYLEDDVELPVLTPSSMLHLRPNQIPELEAHELQDPDLRKRAKYLNKCKEAVWARWSREYVRSLRERHNNGGGGQTPHPSVGDVVIIQDDSRDRNVWRLGIIEELIVGQDKIVRAAKLRAGKGILERAVQQLYPLELSVDRTPIPRLDPAAAPFRPQRDAAAAASLRIQDMTE